MMKFLIILDLSAESIFKYYRYEVLFLELFCLPLIARNSCIEKKIIRKFTKWYISAFPTLFRDLLQITC